MKAYILARIAALPVLIFGVSVLVFIGMRILPGDVAVLIAYSVEEAGGEAIDPQVIRERLGLDKPIPVQYAKWVAGVARGELGVSVWTRRPVMKELKRALPITLELAALSLAISTSVGITLGMIAAVNRGRLIDQVTRVTSIAGLAVPNFWLAILVVTLPAIWFGWAPPVGYRRLIDEPGTNFIQFFVPACVLGASGAALVTRMTRSAMLEVLNQDYVRTAHAKGLQARAVFVRHALRNALIPIVAVLGIQLVGLLGGTLIIETIFSLPGLGSYVFGAALQRDYPAVQGVVMLITVFVIIVNFVVDLTYVYIDPRIRRV